MNFIDIIVIASLIVFAIAGWRQGFVSALFVFIGFLTGGCLAAYAASKFVENLGLTGTEALIVLVISIMVGAIIGQILAAIVGRRLSSLIVIGPFRILDSIGGLVFNTLVIFVLAWVVAVAASGMPSSTVGQAVTDSRVMKTLENVTPAPAKNIYNNFSSLLTQLGVPTFLDGFGLFLPGSVEPPTLAVVDNSAIQASLKSVVKISGESLRCDTGLTGSGFVYAPGRVVTNAHVVAGITSPNIHIPGQRGFLASKVVYLDPKVDVAILAVPALYTKPLRVTESIKRNDNVVIAGYPGGGDMTATAARIRGVVNTRATNELDVFGAPAVTRNIIVLEGQVHPGNSGGPVIDTKGRVVGMVFAQADDNSDTSFALSIKEITPALEAGKSAMQPVSNSQCPNRS